MEMKGGWIAQSGTENGYQYNGKELNEDWGLNWMDYGARWYDASVGRWNGVDIMAAQYNDRSAYNYALNNPLVFFDPNGMWVEKGGVISTTDPDEISAFWGALETMSNEGFAVADKNNSGEKLGLESAAGNRVNIYDKGATFFSDETKAYNFMWNNSYKKERASKDNIEYFGWIAQAGVIVLPTEGVNKSGKKVKNNVYSSNWDLLPYKIDKTGASVQFEGKWYRALAHVHTHPTPGNESHSGEDAEMIDYTKTPGFVISNGKLWLAIPDKRGSYPWITRKELLAGHKLYLTE
jgi:RHS repeat-associated protein